jgi:hypothetical protein
MRDILVFSPECLPSSSYLPGLSGSRVTRRAGKLFGHTQARLGSEEHWSSLPLVFGLQLSLSFSLITLTSMLGEIDLYLAYPERCY